MTKKPQTKEISQIHRLRGQLAGVEKMMQEKIKATEIIQQIEAVRGNLKALERSILTAQCRDFKDAEMKKACNYILKIF